MSAELVAGSRLGPYEIVAPLGAGGMGQVYRARDTRLDRPVAIKVLSAQLAADPQFRQRFDREARAISALDHPHICSLYDVDEQIPSTSSVDSRSTSTAEPIALLVMQYLDFGTLHHMAADSMGNLYVTEVTPLRPENRRVQRFTLIATSSR
ncbi:MAG TPA: protein kinase [Vicinamibacterales bacterium]|jgi:serine/threonine protein kinase